jgi:hypothetical protein
MHVVLPGLVMWVTTNRYIAKYAALLADRLYYKQCCDAQPA